MLRLLANPEQNTKNLLRVVESKTGCCGSEKTECQYTYNDDSLVEVTKIAYGDKEVNLGDKQEGIDIERGYEGKDTSEKVKYTRQVVLPYLFREAGLYADGPNTVTISSDGEEILIESEVELEIEGVTASITKCNRQAVCDYCVSMGTVEDPVFSINGEDKEITADWTYGDTDVGAIQTAIETELDDAIEVIVIDDEVNSLWRVVLSYPCGTGVALNDEEVKVCHTYQDWAE